MTSIINTRTRTSRDVTTHIASRKFCYIPVTIAKRNPLFLFAACILLCMACLTDLAAKSGIASIEIVTR